MSLSYLPENRYKNKLDVHDLPDHTFYRKTIGKQFLIVSYRLTYTQGLSKARISLAVSITAVANAFYACPCKAGLFIEQAIAIRGKYRDRGPGPPHQLACDSRWESAREWLWWVISAKATVNELAYSLDFGSPLKVCGARPCGDDAQRS